jgi:hypothetical protein
MGKVEMEKGKAEGKVKVPCAIFKRILSPQPTTSIRMMKGKKGRL